MVVAYAARGASGFGAAAAMPLLGLVLPLKVLVPAWTLIGIAAGAALMGNDRNKVAWAEMIKLVPARSSASPSASTCSRYCPRTRWRNGSARWCSPMASIRLWGTFGAAAKPHLPPKIAAALGGLGGGMTGTVVGTMGSVFFAMYFDAIKLAKDSYRATMTAILLTLTIIRGVGYFAVGEFSRDVWIVTAILFPSMLARPVLRQLLSPRHERTHLPPHRCPGLDRQRHRPAHQIGRRPAWTSLRPAQTPQNHLCINEIAGGRWHVLCMPA
jgi:hypothetical protein